MANCCSVVTAYSGVVGRLVYYSIIELKQETLMCLCAVNLSKSVFLLNNDIFSPIEQNS